MASFQNPSRHHNQQQLPEAEWSTRSEAPSSPLEEESVEYPIIEQGRSEPKNSEGIVVDKKVSLDKLYFQNLIENNSPLDTSDNILGPIHHGISEGDEHTFSHSKSHARDFSSRDPNHHVILNESSRRPAVSRYLADSERDQPYHTIARALVVKNTGNIRFRKRYYAGDRTGHTIPKAAERKEVRRRNG